MYGLLNDMTIVEGASFVAAPSAGLYLSQMGAEVIRFDNIGGGPDFGRWPVADNGSSLYWEGLNKGKKSVAINLSTPEGRDLATQLITADGENRGLFLTNYPATGFLSHQRLKELRDDLVTVRVMGHRDARPALDYTVNCAVGYPYMTGPTDSPEPVNHVLPAWDLICGTYAAFSMVSAERNRQRSGLGCEIKVPLSDMAAATLSNLGQIAEVMTMGQDRERVGNAIYGMFGRDFETRDAKRLMITVVTGRHWKKLTAILGIGDAAEALEKSLKVDFAADEGARFSHREKLFPLLEHSISKLAYAEITEKLEAEGVVWGPYQTVKEAVEDPFLVSQNPLFSEIVQPSGHKYPAAGAPGTVSEVERGPVRPASKLGAHTEEVFLDYVGMSPKQFNSMIDRNILSVAR